MGTRDRRHKEAVRQAPSNGIPRDVISPQEGLGKTHGPDQSLEPR